MRQQEPSGRGSLIGWFTASLPEERWLLKADEVALLLGLGRSKVFAMIWAHELPVVRLGRAVRVPRDRLIERIRERTAESMADAS